MEAGTAAGHAGDDDTHWQTRFGHLVGYGAGYYSYLVAQVMSKYRSCLKTWRSPDRSAHGAWCGVHAVFHVSTIVA